MQYILNYKIVNKDKNINYLKNIKERIDNISKYLEYAEKLHEIKYLFYAIRNYRITNNLLTEIEEKRMKKTDNNKGIEEFKLRKYDVFIISPNNANEKDKKTFDEIDKEIKLMTEMQKQEKNIEKVKKYFEKNRLKEKDIKSMLK